MLINEVGFVYLLRKIFSIEDVSSEYLLKTAYFEGSENNIKINQPGYEKINNYLEKEKKESNSCLFILGALSTFAYGHPNDAIKNNARKYIGNHYDNILKKLEENIPDQDNTFNEYGKQFSRHLLNIPFSYELIKIISTPRFPGLLKKRENYGIRNLLAYLAAVDFKKFDEWFNITKREDLKILFIHFLLDWRYIEECVKKDFQKSLSPYLRVLSIFKDFPLSRFFPAFEKEVKIKDIVNTYISDKEKSYIAFYHFIEKYREPESTKLDTDKELKEELEFIGKSSFIKHFDVKILNDFSLHSYSYEMVRIFIEAIEDDKQKTELLVCFFEELKDTINTEHITPRNFLVGNTVGRILLSLEEKHTQEIEKLFHDTHRKTYHPYLFFRKNKLWSKNISKLAIYLIALYIKHKSSVKSDNLDDYIVKFHEVKKDYFHILNKELEERLNQITRN